MSVTSTESPVATREATEPHEPAPSQVRRKLGHHVHLAALLLIAGLVSTAVTYDVLVHSELVHAKHSLAATDHRLAKTRSTQLATARAVASTSALRDRRWTATGRVDAEITTTRQHLSTASTTVTLQTLDISTLNTCLTGVSVAASAISASNLPGAVASINSVSSACLTLDGQSGGPVYPFDFPDPFVLTVGGAYYAFATNSAAGNIQIIQSADLVHWTAIGDALPHLAQWAQAGATWAPSVLQRGSSYVLYYSANYALSGEQCISEAVATQPQGPYIDSSQWPIVCQLDLGGSIDPSPYVDPNGTPYLVWKSQGASGQPATLWSQQLTADATSLVAGTPSALLRPSRGWQHGTIEGPDMIAWGGQYLLFYSGSDWKTASYAIGYAICAGPLGPCTDQSSQPLAGSQAAFSGPGGPSLFADSGGTLWLAFHAWLPGSVGYPDSRPLYLRQVTISGGVPAIGP